MKKKINYGGKELHVISQTLNFYFVSENKDGSNQYSISKKDYAAYKKESKS
jgi:hypothetical protein